MTGALSRVRICDFTGQLAGAGATRLLAAFGAQVIRIEDNVAQGRWDTLRGNAPFPDERRGIELGGAFQNHNVEKLFVTLNLRRPGARDLVRRLIAVSDIVTENFASGVLERWGLSYEEMVKINPSVVYVSNSGFGHSGPYADSKTWGPIVQAVCGLTFLSGLAGREPAGWGYSYMDHTGSYFMAMAVLMALYHRARTGEGQYVDMSCTDAGALLCGPVLLDYTVNGRRARRPGFPDSNRSDHPAMAPHGIYRCAGDDAWVAIAARDDGDWARLCEVAGRPEWAGDARFSTLPARLAHQDDLDRLVEGWTTGLGPYDVMEALQARGVPAAAVQRPEDRIERDPNVQAWGLFPEVEHPEMGRVRVDGIPVRMSETPSSIQRATPLLGQHNEFVYGEVLGLSRTEIARLREDEAIS